MRGSCLCGTVSYELTAPPELMVHCHCSRCRKAHGAAWATFVSLDVSGFRWLSGEEGIAAPVLPGGGARRPFCRSCGSPLPCNRGGRVDIPAGALEGPLPPMPGLHIFVGSRASWVELTDDLPKHETYPQEWMDEG